MVQAGYTKEQADADVFTYAKRLNFYVDNFSPRMFTMYIKSYIDAMQSAADVTSCEANINHYLHLRWQRWDNFDFYGVRRKLFSIVSAITWAPL